MLHRLREIAIHDITPNAMDLGGADPALGWHVADTRLSLGWSVRLVGIAKAPLKPKGSQGSPKKGSHLSLRLLL